MKATVAVALLAAWMSAAASQAAQPASPALAGSAKPNQDAATAAESFLNSAVDMTCSPDTTAARAGRLVALSHFADRLAPGDRRADRLLADIYLAQSDPNAEISAMESYLAGQPDDYVVRLRWINARLSKLQNVAERDAFLRSLADRKHLDEPARAQVLAILADLLFGQGRTAEAAKAAKRALTLDPYGAGPLTAWARISDPNGFLASMGMDLRMLRGQPRAFDTAWRVALRLTGLGLYREAMGFYGAAWSAGMADRHGANISARMAVQYGSAMLDANQPDKATGALEATSAMYVDNTDLESLLIEAYKSAGKATQAARLIEKLAKAYKSRETSGIPGNATLAELGWFYAVTQPDQYLSIIYARKAVDADANNPVYQRILGAAELAAGKVDQAVPRLAKLLGKDIYASVLLAERYEATGDKQKLREALFAGAPLAGGGPAARKLRKIAAKHHIALPVPKQRDPAQALLKDFPRDCLRMVDDPNNCVSVKLSTVGDGESLLCGDPVEVAATLKNVGAVDLPLGEMGVLNPRMALAAEVADASGQTIAKTARLPLVVWPAPRYLSPGRTITCQVRLDVCELAAALGPHPLDDLTITVTGTVDPTVDGASRLPNLTVAPLKIARRGLLGKVADDSPAGWLAAYKLALGRIVRDYRRGTLPERMRAARQIGSLLAFATRVQDSRIVPPGMLRGQTDRLVILAMFRAILSDKSPAVRAEAVASIHMVRPDELVVSLLGPRIQDRDPMVRCRVVELLAATGSKGNETIIDLMSNDPDPLVRQMANAFKAR